MDEEVIDYLYKWALSDGFKRSKEDFVNLLQKDDEVLSYAFEFAQKDGFKKDKNALGVLVGRTTTAAPVATTEPAKTEVVATTTEPAKTEPAKTEPTVTETVKAEPTATIATETAPAKTEVVAETKVTAEPMTKTEPQITVKEVEAPVKEEPKKELPVSTGLTPITEKTEVKAVETPSDKMVIKSEKTQSVPSETIQGKGLFVSEDLKDIKLPKYKPEEIIDKKLLTENKESLGLKQFEDRDLIFKKWLESKGMPLNTKEESLNSEDISEYNRYQYNQESNLTRAIVDSYLPYLIENKDKLSSEYQEKLREELTSPTFKVFVQGFRGDFYNYDKNNPNFKLIEKVNEEYWRDPAIYSHVKSQYGIQDGEKQKMDANEFLQSPILKNSEKVITKFGPMFYDKENDTYYKYEYGILNAEPYVKYQLKNNPDYQAPLEIIKPGTEQHKLIKEGNKETIKS